MTSLRKYIIQKGASAKRNSRRLPYFRMIDRNIERGEDVREETFDYYLQKMGINQEAPKTIPLFL